MGGEFDEASNREDGGWFLSRDRMLDNSHTLPLTAAESINL